jgi:AraC family transcriptional regulator
MDVNDLSSIPVDIRIIKLPAFRVASYRAMSKHPEKDAWKVLDKWAQENRLLNEATSSGLFGFDNPGPSKDKPVYGYEVWMRVGADVVESGDIKIKDFPGGLYAVTRTYLPTIGENWQRMVNWRKKSPYKHGSHQWLEQPLSPHGTPDDSILLDLYLPIAE